MSPAFKATRQDLADGLGDRLHEEHDEANGQRRVADDDRSQGVATTLWRLLLPKVHLSELLQAVVPKNEREREPNAGDKPEQ